MRILSISTGLITRISVPAGDGPGRIVRSAIDKKVVSDLVHPEAIFAGPLGLEGDEQADKNVHGGPSMAVYAYPAEHYAFWLAALKEQGREIEKLPNGFFGENLTVEGFVEAEVFVGDLWQVGEVEFMVEDLRKPCFKFDAKIGFAAGPTMIRAARSGWYLSVMQSGIIKAGDLISVEAGDRVTSIAGLNAALKKQRKITDA